VLLDGFQLADHHRPNLMRETFLKDPMDALSHEVVYDLLAFVQEPSHLSPKFDPLLIID